MRVRTPRLVVKVVSGGKRRNYEQRSGSDGDGDAIKGRKNAGWVLCINNTIFCSSSSRKPAVEEMAASSSARKINMLKEVVADRLRTVSRGRGRGDETTIIVPDGKSSSSSSKKIVLGIKGETTQKLGRSFNCLVSRFSGMFRLKKKEKKKSGFRRLRKWKINVTMRKSSSSVGAVKKSLERIRSCCRMRMGRKMHMMRKESEEEEIELCKKRILMGDKCKPLNVSGTLHYDKNGVLLPEPELLLPCQ